MATGPDVPTESAPAPGLGAGAPDDAEAVALAVDIGGTKMAAGLVDRWATIRVRHQVPTPPGADAEALWSALVDLLVDVGEQGRRRQLPPPTVCGVGCGGPMVAGGRTVSPVNITGWCRFPLRDRLSEWSGLPTAVDNDAKALTRAEGWRGAAAGVANYLGMVVSTGVGGGIVCDGRLLEGGDGNAGHIGHVIVEPDGHRCGCGAVGCLEAEASGTAIARITGRPATEAGPEVVERTGVLVGRAVASVANLLDLRLAVVAGSVALGFGAPFFAAAQAEIDRRSRLDHSVGARIRPAGLGPDAPLVGAAAVGWAHLGHDPLGAPGPGV